MSPHSLEIPAGAALEHCSVSKEELPKEGDQGSNNQKNSWSPRRRDVVLFQPL